MLRVPEIAIEAVMVVCPQCHNHILPLEKITLGPMLIICDYCRWRGMGVMWRLPLELDEAEDA